jgi:dTDP-4-amino-4,6-dideoxygalactose transaminase
LIRLTRPTIDESDLRAVERVLSSGGLVQGATVQEFEGRIAESCASPYAVALSSGTAALHSSLLAVGVRPGDKILVSAYSFVATANVVEMCGAVPVFVDIDASTYNMDPSALASVLARRDRSSNDAFKAIMPVHAFGQIADMDAICSLARERDLHVIEDAACALGATLATRPAGTWGDVGCFSFHPRKVITTGEGGAIVTADLELASRVRAIRNHGQDPEARSTDFVMPGLNYRMTEIQAALGLAQMQKFGWLLERRRRLASVYDDLLSNSSIKAPTVHTGCVPSYQSYVVQLPESMATRRDALVSYMHERGVETAIGTWHIPLTTYYRRRYGFRPGDFPQADIAFARALALPLDPDLTHEDQRFVVSTLEEGLDRLAA